MRERILAVLEKNSRIDIHDLAILLRPKSLHSRPAMKALTIHTADALTSQASLSLILPCAP